jgi:hypothetical protein
MVTKIKAQPEAAFIQFQRKKHLTEPPPAANREFRTKLKKTAAIPRLHYPIEITSRT